MVPKIHSTLALDRFSTHVLEIAVMDRTEQAREYVHTWKGRWPELCAESGVQYQWLTKFSQGVIKEPRARLIDALLAHRDLAVLKAKNAA